LIAFSPYPRFRTLFSPDPANADGKRSITSPKLRDINLSFAASKQSSPYAFPY